MNKAEQMGYGNPAGQMPDGTPHGRPDGLPFPDGNPGSFNEMAAAVPAALEAGKVAKFNAEHTEALVMDKARTQAMIAERVVSPEMQELNNAAEVAIFGSKGRTAGYVDAEGNPVTSPVKGKLDDIRENPRYGTKEADREAAATKYQADVEELVGEGFELCQAKLIMDARELRTESLDMQRRQHNLEFNRQMNLLTNQYMTNGQSRAAATKLAKDRLAVRNVKEYKSPTKAALKKQDKDLKSFIKDEGIFTVDEIAMALRGTSIYGARVPETDPADPADAVTAVHNPVASPNTNRGLRNRARNLMARAHVALAGIGNYYSDADKGKRRKLATAAGIVAAGAFAYLELKGGGASQHVADRPKTGVNPLDVQSPADLPKPPQAGLNPGGPSAAPSLIDHVPGTHPGSESHKALETFTVQDGQNPWTISEHQLKLHGFHHPSPAQIEAYDKQMAGLNPDVYSYSGDSSEHIDVGTKLKLPKFRFR